MKPEGSEGRSIYEALKKAAGGNLVELFETIRRDIGRKGFASQNDGIHWSKVGIRAVKARDLDLADEADAKMRSALEGVRSANLPDDLKWEFGGALASEYVEFWGFRILYPQIFLDFSEEEVVKMLLEKFEGARLREIGVSEQAWLAGLADVPGELSRALTDYRVENELTIDEHVALLRRYIKAVGPIVDYLDEFETVYDMAIAISRRRGWFNTFRARLGRAKSVLLSRKEQLETLLARQAS